MGKTVKPAKRGKKEELSSKDWLHYTIFVTIWVLFVMWLYGMADTYFPDPIHIGFGQYLDIAQGIIILGFTVFFIFSSVRIWGVMAR